MNQRSGIRLINKHGLLLVFPVNNKSEPSSLWSLFFPRSKMRWEWDSEGDDRVARLWQLMKSLSDCREVIYSKWYQGRATFFSKKTFSAMLCLLKKQGSLTEGLSPSARSILEILESDSPLSTKELKKLADLQGRFNEPEYNRAMKQLFSRFLIVAYGEVEDGAFPSLAVGATQHLYEELWLESERMSVKEAQSVVDHYLPKGSLFRKFFEGRIFANKKEGK